MDDKIKAVIGETEDAIQELRQNQENLDKNTGVTVQKIIAVLTKSMQNPELAKQENEQLLAEVVRRLKELVEAYQGSDIVRLADVLQYEIMELLYFCIDLENMENR